MSKERIKEIAKDIPFLELDREVFVSSDRKEWHSWMLSEEDTVAIAEALCDKGYRRESETAKEIIDEIKRIKDTAQILPKCLTADKFTYFLNRLIDKIADKYNVAIEDARKN